MNLSNLFPLVFSKLSEMCSDVMIFFPFRWIQVCRMVLPLV